MTAEDLIAFEREVYDLFAAQKIKGPIHLSGGNESQLIEIFKDIKRTDWVFSTYRSHYHALLHGIPRDWLLAEIIAGRSMGIHSLEHRFMSSAIVGGMLPIAVGVAYALKKRQVPQSSKDALSRLAKIDVFEPKVWCFIGDMCGSTGVFRDAINYSRVNQLPIEFIIEDNGFSCDTPTMAAWGYQAWLVGYVYVEPGLVRAYAYQRTYPHAGIGRNVF